MSSYDVCVRGTGPVGRSLALALSRQGLRVALVGGMSRQDGPDVRTYALNAGSVHLLDALRVWQPLCQGGAATAVHEMVVAGDAGGQLEFSSWRQAVDELAWIVDAAALDERLEQAVQFAPHITVLPEQDRIDAPLLAVCEGKASPSRDRLGVQFERLGYGHHGVSARLVCDQPHRGRAWQWFRSPDILALLPFDRPTPAHGYGLVWSVPEARAQELLDLPEPEFERALGEATGGAAGALRLASPRAAWPLAIGRAEAWSGPGWVLVGDAAHQVHPLSGQGLNLGLADVIALDRVLREREPWRALGDERLLARYVRARALPTQAMAALTDGLWHLFADQHGPVRELRNRGMSLLNHLPPLKRWLTARALDH